MIDLDRLRFLFADRVPLGDLSVTCNASSSLSPFDDESELWNS